MKKYYLIIIVVSLLALWPFFKKGYFTSHDGEWMVIRFSAFHQAFRTGQIPVRFVDRLNNNYGYPVLNFLYPLPFYLSEIPKIAGFGFVDSVKITFIISTLISTIGMFWALSQRFSKVASFAGSMIYIFNPYRFVDLYVRGSLGENMAFAILPLVLGSIFKIAKGEKKYLPLMAVSVALLVLAHNVIAILFLPFFVVLVALIVRKNLTVTAGYFALGIFIASFFWLSALWDLQFVRLSQIEISDPVEHLVPLSKMIYSNWNFGPTPKEINGFSAQIGILSASILLFAIYIKIKAQNKSRFLNFLLVSILVSIFLVSSLSTYLWQRVPFIDVIQYPWRLLSVIVFATAILAAHLVHKINKPAIGLAVASVAALLTIRYTIPFQFVDRTEGFYSTNEDSTTIKDEYLPRWVEIKPPRANEKIQDNKDVEVLKKEVRPAHYKYELHANSDTAVTINTIYFPGFVAKVDNITVPIKYEKPGGLISFQLPKGRHEAIIKYARSPIHLASELISLTALGITLILIFKLWRKQIS